MDSTKLPQRIRDLDARRRALIASVLRPLPMVIGYLFQKRCRCGNPRCRCARGKLHVSWYLSRREGGKAKLKHVGRLIPEWLSERVRRYQGHQQTLAAIRRIDREISALLQMKIFAEHHPELNRLTRPSLLRQERKSLNKKPLPHIRQQLLPADNHVIVYWQNYYGLFNPYELVGFVVQLSEEARKKIVEKCRRLGRELNGILKNPRAP